MAISTLINMAISLQEIAASTPSFGIPAIVGDFASGIDTAFGANLFAELTPINWATVMTGLGFTSADTAYKAAQDLFSQTRKPPLALIGRRSTPVAQVIQVNVDGTDNGDYTITINGTDFTFAASSNTATEIKDGLIALVTGVPVTAASVDTDSLSLTADEEGRSFTYSVTNTDGNLSTAVTAANVGLAEDMVAWKAERNDFYGVILLEKTDGQLLEFADVMEAETKIGFAMTDDANVQGSASDDIASQLNAGGWTRTMLNWHDDDGEHVMAAIVGKMFPTTPGEEAWAKQTLSSVTGIKPTNDMRLRNKNCFYLEAFEAIDGSIAKTMTTNAKMVGGTTWVDLVWGRDWLFSKIRANILTVMADSPKIPYTSLGAEVYAAAIEAALNEAADNNFVVRSSIDVQVPVAEDQSAANKTGRHLPNVLFFATLQGDIETLDITGQLAA